MNIENEQTDGIVDAKKFEVASRQVTDPLEKEEREKTKKLAKPAPKGKYICTTTIKGDEKTFTKGDEYEGKLYADLLAAKAVVTKEEWNNR